MHFKQCAVRIGKYECSKSESAESLADMVSRNSGVASTPTFCRAEQEAIILNAAWGMINDMVNYEMFVKPERTHDIILMFNTSSHMRLFNILLGDFLGLASGAPFDLPTPTPTARSTDRTHLLYLAHVCADPQLNPDASAIKKPLDDFRAWLEADALVEKVWLSAINLELDVRASRIRLFKLCGDIAKHNFTRLSQTVHGVRKLVRENGHEIDEGQAYLALDDFYEWFHRDIFAYHSSTIAEHLNNLRWGIYEYLRPEFARSFHRVEPAPMYRFHIPDAITNPLAKEMYWDLMNKARSEPWMPAFSVSEYIKLRY
ncbi:MAG: hypothetical protein J0L81_02360 [Caulobacterales bacterium]|nr:hypothetical protein [Caulobacterales bacterium]